MKYYVSCNAKRNGNGTKTFPFSKIQFAADIALPGDEIIVSPGVYREHVNPKHSGTAEQPIIYKSEKPGMAIITGSEQLSNWKYYQNNVWIARIPNGIFGTYNPYTTLISGDWYYPIYPLHTGELYFNGKSMYEAASLEDVLNPRPFVYSEDAGFSVYKWYSLQENDCTVIYANFQGNDPTQNLIECNVRRNCFFASQTGINYITVSGFVIKQAATTWAPPTAFQDGMIGPHWAKGWIIENCEISDSKCVGIILGKYYQENNENKWTLKRMKQGTQTERDAICQAQLEGWSKENIGSHIIRNCTIHDCEQAGIAGHLGCAFSVIEHNHVYNINNKHQLEGAEIAGIKLHAAIDTLIAHNHIHNCTRGLWLDWQAQGTRITRNLFHDNFPFRAPECITSIADIGEDLFVEVSHGPTLIDHNIMLTPQACRLATQGLAFVHNLICGSFLSIGEGSNNVSGFETNKKGTDVVDAGPRYTPYHVPHRTEIAGFMTILHGDCRLYNNIFLQRKKVGTYDAYYHALNVPAMNSTVGTFPYNEYPTEPEYIAKFFIDGDSGRKEDRTKYYTHLPVSTGGNVFFNGAVPCKKEENYVNLPDTEIYLELKEDSGKYYLDTNLNDYIPDFETPFISSSVLKDAFEPEQRFENPDGSEILFDEDYFGLKRNVNPTPGPFESKECWNACIYEEVKHEIEL